MRRARPIASSPSGLDVRQLQAFVALVEHGRMTAAAQAMGLAQSTVSEAIAALERALGTPVIVRRRGTADGQLTDAGRTLLPYARKVIAAVEEARLAVAATTNTAHADVDIVANPAPPRTRLDALVSSSRARHPAADDLLDALRQELSVSDDRPPAAAGIAHHPRMGASK